MTKPPGLRNYKVTPLDDIHKQTILSLVETLEHVPPDGMCVRCGERTNWYAMCHICRQSCEHQWINGYIMRKNGIAAARARCLKCAANNPLRRGAALFDICFMDRTVEEPPQARPPVPAMPPPMRIGILTRYHGVQFRSRLEAKWAAFFDQIGWQWEYEPFDGRGYIPDFLIQGEQPFLVEIKPAVTERDYHEPVDKIRHGLEGVWERDVLILGASPLPSIRPDWGSGVVAGLLGIEQFSGAWLLDDPSIKGWNFTSLGGWFVCGDGNLVVTDFFGGSACMPCGCSSGDLGLAGEETIRTAWAEATNAVQWMAAS